MILWSPQHHSLFSDPVPNTLARPRPPPLLGARNTWRDYLDGMRELALGTKWLEDGEEWRTPRPILAEAIRGRRGLLGCLGERMREGKEEGRPQCF
jgi:hypothetical protein